MNRRRTLLVILFVLAALLQFDIARVIGPRWGRPPANPQQQRDLSEGEREFLLRQYETAREEIRVRIEQESLLFGFKFTLVGAILALVFGSHLRGLRLARLNAEHAADEAADTSERPRGYLVSPLSACIFWAAVVCSAIIDTRILFHADVMVTLGSWIRDNVEAQLLERPIGWEHYVSEESALFGSRMYSLLRFNIHLLTLVLFAVTTLTFSGELVSAEDPDHGAAIRRICLFGSLGSFVCFFLVGIHFHYWTPLWIGWCIVLLAAGIVVSFVLWRSTDVQGEARR